MSELDYLQKGAILENVRILRTSDKSTDGIAKIDGLVVFVPGTFPGDVVNIRIKSRGYRCALAERIP